MAVTPNVHGQLPGAYGDTPSAWAQTPNELPEEKHENQKQLIPRSDHHQAVQAEERLNAAAHIENSHMAVPQP